jgi:predicted unusual protein kinase regulating ubiquinone biosynthesis (AarF/ABC1/UbiB family)
VGSVDVKSLTAEIADRIREEVDYLKEAEHQSIAAAAYASDTEFAVPSVLTATRRVLVSQWLDGSKLNAVAEWNEERRNAVGLSYVRFLFSAPQRAGLLHADPHPGNFLVLEDGRLGIVDWGLVARLPDGLPEPMGRLIRTALHGNAAEVAAGLRQEGLLVGDVDPQDLMTLLSPFIEPAAASEFHFTRDWMRGEYQRLASEGHSSETVMNKLNVPPVYALIHRVWMGGIAVLSQLDVRASFSDVLTDFLPGFAER